MLGALDRIERALDDVSDVNPAHGRLLADELRAIVATYPERVEARSGVRVRLSA